jgi:RNA polymerase sigma-70 factor (ECF subfamily)
MAFIMSDPSFGELLGRVRAGDADAAADLVRKYEPAVRRAVRFRLSNAHMRNTLDSMDICQSVMASFFIRAASGQYELAQPEQLQKLLVAMARNKLAFQVRKQHAARRDQRRNEASAGADAFVAAGSSPSQQVAARDLLQAVHNRLSAEERRLVDLRNQGLEWAEIAGRLDGSPEALRKQLTRALDRVADELGVDETGHG